MESWHNRKDNQNERPYDAEKYLRYVEFISDYKLRLSKEACIVPSRYSQECVF